ncbi:pseudouridine synthase [Aquimarina agarivorans]|uniref:pseudouridine synthase n=1 Tax=Aquimarina agarivorans TaxID=980584 RepID=UPI000248EC6A|nr:pseudouridine synthase [Aquimarina agarivorans]
MIYKPYGYLSQFVNNGPKKAQKKLLGTLYNFPEHVMSVGRLDEKSEGLLFITTNGKISNAINSSAYEKEYYALVDGAISAQAIKKLQNGVEIGFNGIKYQTKPCKVNLLKAEPVLPLREKKIRDARHGPVTWISVTLTEGKFRQVRKMTSAVGFPTLRLVRVRVGNVRIKTMQSGEVIPLMQSPLEIL